jgi:hypothetical protein
MLAMPVKSARDNSLTFGGKRSANNTDLVHHDLTRLFKGYLGLGWLRARFICPYFPHFAAKGTAICGSAVQSELHAGSNRVSGDS